MLGAMNQETPIEQLVPTEDLAEALKGDRFKQFLDKIPITLLLASLSTEERIIYANAQFETLTGQLGTSVEGHSWDILEGRCRDQDKPLSQAIMDENDHIGVVIFDRPDGDPVLADAYSNVI